MLLFCDSFSTYNDPLMRYATVTANSWTPNYAAAGRFDGKGMLLAPPSGNAFCVTPNLGNHATMTIGFALYIGLSSGSTSWSIGGIADAGVAQVNIALSGSLAGGGATLDAQRNGVSLGSPSAVVFTYGTWHFVELQATIHPTAGSTTLKLDGNVIQSFTGVNTQNTGNAFANQAYLAGAQNGFATQYFDDFYVCDTTGTANNTFLGEIKVAGGTPAANGSASAYAQNVAARIASTAYALGVTILDSNSNLQRVTSAGTSGSGAPTWNTTVGGTTTDGGVTWTNLGAQAAWKLVNETGTDDDSSYLSDSTVGDQARFTFPGIGSVSVKGTMLYARARKDDAGSRAIRLVAKSSSTVADNGSDFTLLTSWGNYIAVFENDPATGTPWTATTLNAAEFGVKTTV
jgi:protein involved in polysaccharide export with SLBB domain